jgi:lipopolysaccharide transport system permease protein
MQIWIIEYSELIKNLVASELKTKYRGSVLGFAWSMLNPLALMLVLYFVFYNVFRFRQENFALYVLIGVISWRFLAIGTTVAMGSIVGKSSLVTKIYLPREALVLGVTLANFIGSILEFLVLIPLVFLLGVGLSYTIILFPLVHLLYLLLVYGLSLLLASLYVFFRDVNQIWEVVLNVGFFASPIVYPLSIIPAKYMGPYMLNPMTRLIEMYRDIILFGRAPTAVDFIIVSATAIAVLVIGQFAFSRLSRRFAEAM